MPPADRRRRRHAGADGVSQRPGRDELLTALIIDAYDALADTAEAADAGRPPADIRGRWEATCHAVRDRALAHPHEYALIYGSPLAGYQAPQATVAPATRVADAIAPGVPEAMIARLLIAWTQLFGMISFELFGQLVGSADPADAFFGYAVGQMADFIGLP